MPEEAKSYPTSNHKKLFAAILKLKNINEAVKFFRDLLTIGEINDFAQRWKIARLLNKGLPYSEVAQKTKASTTTVSRVAHWLHHGRGGYKLILKRFEKELKKTSYRSPLLEMAKGATGPKKGPKKDYSLKADEVLYGER